MWPLYRGILNLIDLPEELKESIKTAVDEGVAGTLDPRAAVKRLLPLFESIAIEWPYDAEVFDERYTSQKKRLERLYQQALHEVYIYRRYQRMLETVDSHPYWQIVMIDDPSTPEECRAKANRVLHYTDPFWQEGPVFSEKEGCRCRLRAFSKLQYQRMQLAENYKSV